MPRIKKFLLVIHDLTGWVLLYVLCLLGILYFVWPLRWMPWRRQKREAQGADQGSGA
jgi:hypothetical protein